MIIVTNGILYLTVEELRKNMVVDGKELYAIIMV